jgi:hypothetical protein
MLPDIPLLRIFDFYMYEERRRLEAWQTLVHVCRKWRIIVFGSPRRLDLRLYCTDNTPVRETLDVWPPLPIVVWNGDKMLGDDSIVAALEHHDRICELILSDIPSSQLDKVLAAFRHPFPALTRLCLGLEDEIAPVVPALFLGEPAPRLQSLSLYGKKFRGLPKLLLSATHLVDLELPRIPHSGYISPEEMVTVLSALTRLKRLLILFESPRHHPDRRSRRPPPQARTVLPVLVELRFKGTSEYLEDFVARIDAPLLHNLGITFFHELIFDTPQLTQFVRRAPKFEAHGEARVFFSDRHVSVTLPGTFIELAISCRQSDWQLSSLTRVCSSSFLQAFISEVEHLSIYEGRSEASRMRWQNDIESNQWLEFLHPFTAVKSLYISRKFTPRTVPALQELVGERVTEVLPALQTLFLGETVPSGPVQEIIGQFVAARQLAGHPIAV